MPGIADEHHAAGDGIIDPSLLGGAELHAVVVGDLVEHLARGAFQIVEAVPNPCCSSFHRVAERLGAGVAADRVGLAGAERKHQEISGRAQRHRPRLGPRRAFHHPPPPPLAAVGGVGFRPARVSYGGPDAVGAHDQVVSFARAVREQGPTGRLLNGLGRHPWRPAHIHVKISADGYQPLTTQLYFQGDELLNSDVASVVKDDLIVPLQPAGSDEGSRRTLRCDFQLAPVGP